MEFSERLKDLRKQAELTQVDVAEKLGISQPAYASWERGVKKPTQDNLVKIAQILNVSVDYLVGNSEENLDELDNIELLFRMNSKGLTDSEKAIFGKKFLGKEKDKSRHAKSTNKRVFCIGSELLGNFKSYNALKTSVIYFHCNYRSLSN